VLWASLGIPPDAAPLGRGASGAVYAGESGGAAAAVKVGRRRLSVTNSELKARLLSALEIKM